MKSQKLFLWSLLGLLSSSAGHAADVMPTQIKAFEDDLARPEIKLTKEYAYRFGINFVEGHNYVLHPQEKKAEDASSIRREFNASLRLPFNIETGLALYDSQQATSDQLTAIYGKVDHKSQKLGGAIWARYHLISSEKLNASVLLQYEPGTADSASFHQASQDKKGVAFHLDGSPLAYTQAGIFFGATRREDEKFRRSRLNDELLYGARVSVGVPLIQVFGGSQIRGLPWKIIGGKSSIESSIGHELGLSTTYQSLSVQASALIPSSKPLLGVAEKGFKISLQLTFGKSKSSTSSGEGLGLSNKATAPKAKRKGLNNLEATPDPIDLKNATKEEIDAFKSDVKEEGLGQIPVFKDNLPKATAGSKNQEILTAPGPDEFEKWEEQSSADSKHVETATERAEREYKAQIAKEKKMNKAKDEQEVVVKELEKRRLLKEMEKEEKEALKSAAEIEKELNAYTLPGADETNWKGLSK